MGQGIETALADILDFKRKPDAVDKQFDNLWPDIHQSAGHAYVREGRSVPATKAALLVASTLFKAWYRSIYYRSSGYGGIVFVHRCPATLYWLRRYISALLAIRGVNAAELRAENCCTAMRSSRDAVGYPDSAMFYGLPFPNIMSWDVSLMLSVAQVDESFYFATQSPDQWTIKPTQAGEVLRLEDRVPTLLDVVATVDRLRREVSHG